MSANDREPTERKQFRMMATMYHLTDGDTTVAISRDVLFAEVNRIQNWSDEELLAYGRAAVERGKAKSGE